jgi:hypothetical protein
MLFFCIMTHRDIIPIFRVENYNILGYIDRRSLMETLKLEVICSSETSLSAYKIVIRRIAAKTGKLINQANLILRVTLCCSKFSVFISKPFLYTQCL